ncbi:MAG: hypothetical protein QME79_12510 [Bacillota bacterium]|nr:hypothetical protein [Bacillota bacterium]
MCTKQKLAAIGRKAGHRGKGAADVGARIVFGSKNRRGRKK